MEPAQAPHPVRLYVYDLSRGLARRLSPVMLEGGTLLGAPDTVVDLGSTEVTEEIFLEYLSSLGESGFSGECYHLFDHNCNTFSNEVAQFLTGRKIPSYITELPFEVLST
ncbi:hypothetical protein FKM82_004594 [Ascaphus truei]